MRTLDDVLQDMLILSDDEEDDARWSLLDREAAQLVAQSADAADFDKWQKIRVEVLTRIARYG